MTFQNAWSRPGGQFRTTWSNRKEAPTEGALVVHLSVAGSEEVASVWSVSEPLRLDFSRDRLRVVAMECHLALVVRGVQGFTWLTQDGDKSDNIIGPGDEFRVAPHSKWMILQGFSDSRVHIELQPASTHDRKRVAGV